MVRHGHRRIHYDDVLGGAAAIGQRARRVREAAAHQLDVDLLRAYVREVALDLIHVDAVAVGAAQLDVDAELLAVGLHEAVVALIDGLGDFLGEKGFGSVREVVGHSLPYFTSHHDLADRQKAKKEGTEKSSDMQWGDDLTTTTQELMTN